MCVADASFANLPASESAKSVDHFSVFQARESPRSLEIELCFDWVLDGAPSVSRTHRVVPARTRVDNLRTLCWQGEVPLCYPLFSSVLCFSWFLSAVIGACPYTELRLRIHGRGGNRATFWGGSFGSDEPPLSRGGALKNPETAVTGFISHTYCTDPLIRGFRLGSA